MNLWLLGGLALAPMDHARLDLADGARVEGPVSAISPGTVVIHVGEGIHVPVPLEQITAAQVDGQSIDPAVFREEAETYLKRRYGPPGQPTPAPWAVTLASWIIPGGGQALLGDWAGFAAYAISDGVVLSLGGLLLSRGNSNGVLPCLALDLTFRFYSAGEARAEAISRERRNP
jgi:hypothetical protein